MNSYKIGDLTKVFEREHVSSQTTTSNSTGVQNEASLFGAGERSKDKQLERNVSKSDNSNRKKVSQFQTKREEEKAKKERQDKLFKTDQKKIMDTSQPLDQDTGTKIKGRTVKKTQKQISIPSNKVHTTGFDPPPGILHESLSKKGRKRGLDDDDTANKEDNPTKKTKACDLADEPRKARKKNIPSHTEEEDRRTIFIGNLSLQVTEKDLKKMFREFGEIESVRRRCVPVKDPDQRKKRVAAIIGEFHPERHNSICYIKFKTEDAAKKALVNNGKLVQNLHIRVDIASESSREPLSIANSYLHKDVRQRKNLNNFRYEHFLVYSMGLMIQGSYSPKVLPKAFFFWVVKRDTKRTVFVANLPFDVEEEPLRGHFEDCGDIENVRIVRDRKTCLGKGIGYVKFMDPASMSLALKLNGSSFQERSLRVQRCQYNTGADKSRNVKTKPVTNKSRSRPAQGNKSKSGQKSSKFQGEKSKKLCKRKKKSNIKSSSSTLFAINRTVKKKDNLQKHLGSNLASNKSVGKHIKFD